MSSNHIYQDQTFGFWWESKKCRWIHAQWSDIAYKQYSSLMSAEITENVVRYIGEKFHDPNKENVSIVRKDETWQKKVGSKFFLTM